MEQEDAARLSWSSVVIFGPEEEVVGCFEALGNDPGVGGACHEISVAVPPGNDMPMEVGRDPGSPGGSHVHSDVKSIWVEYSLNPGCCVADELVDLKKFLVAQVAEIGGVLIGGDHQVSARIRVAIEDDESGFSSVEDEIFGVVTLSREVDENAAGLIGLVGGFDVIESPRSPELFGHRVLFWLIIVRWKSFYAFAFGVYSG